MPKAKRRFSPRKATVIALLVVLVLGGMVSLSREELGEIYRATASADRSLVLCAILLYFFEVLLWAGRWRVALLASGYRVDLKSLYLISHAGMFFSNITPISKSGGEPFRAYFIKKTHKVPYPVGFATILAEGLLTLPPILGVLLLGTILRMWLSPSLASVALLAMGALFLGSLLLLGFLFIRRKLAARGIVRAADRIAKFFKLRFDEKKAHASIQKFYSSAQLVLRDTGKTLLILTIATLLYILSSVRVFLILVALGTDPPLAAPLLAVTVPLLAGCIPLLPGGLVLFEGTMVAVLVGCGIPLPISVAATLIERGISYVLSTLAGALAALYLGVRGLKK